MSEIVNIKNAEENEREHKNMGPMYIIAISMLLLIIIGLVIFIRRDSLYREQPAGNVKVEEGKKLGEYAANNKSEAQVETLEIPGLGDLELQKGYGVALGNPEVNGQYLQFRVTNKDTKELIKETGLIEPGEEIVWVPSENIDVGVYPLRIEILSYETPESSGVLRVNNDIQLTLLQ